MKYTLPFLKYERTTVRGMVCAERHLVTATDSSFTTYSGQDVEGECHGRVGGNIGIEMHGGELNGRGGTAGDVPRKILAYHHQRRQADGHLSHPPPQVGHRVAATPISP